MREGEILGHLQEVTLLPTWPHPLLLSCWVQKVWKNSLKVIGQGVPRGPSTTQATAIALGCPPEGAGKALVAEGRAQFGYRS